MKTYLYKLSLNCPETDTIAVGIAVAENLVDLFWMLDRTADPHAYQFKELKQKGMLEIYCSKVIVDAGVYEKEEYVVESLECSEKNIQVDYDNSTGCISDEIIDDVLEGNGWRKFKKEGVSMPSDKSKEST
jgi:hypothetical protein